MLSPAAGITDEDAAAGELAVTCTVVVPTVVVPLIVVIKLLSGPTVAVAADDSVAELGVSDEVDEGKDCPLAGIGMMLVDVALDAAAMLVCEACAVSVAVVEPATSPVENAREVAAAPVAEVVSLANDSVVEP